MEKYSVQHEYTIDHIRTCSRAYISTDANIYSFLFMYESWFAEIPELLIAKKEQLIELEKGK